jgi:hypothetical protein
MVFQQHIALDHQKPDEILASGLGNIYSYRFLAPVSRQEIGGFVGVIPIPISHERRAPTPSIIANAGPLYLDHFGAEIGKGLAAPGTGQNTAHIEDADMI